MQIACESIAVSGRYLCLYVDGLDEYGGDSDDILWLLKIFTEIRHVKICASSRPENAFIQAWEETGKKLYMEHFNDADISAYVRDTLEADPNYQDMDDRGIARIDLAQEIVSHAKGVFLWVHLVLVDLKEGLRNRDTLDQLWRRLHDLPKDLEDFFLHILFKRIPEFYRQRSAAMFLISLDAVDLLPVIACWYITEGSSELDKDRDVRQATMLSNNRRRKEVQARLNVDCKGLLEVQHQSLPAKLESLAGSILYSQKVNFLHRTVREFLSKPEVSRQLSLWLPASVDTDEMICKALLAQISTSPTTAEFFSSEGPISDLVEMFVSHHAKLQKRSRQATAKQLLQQLASVLPSQSVTNGNTLASKMQDNSTPAPSDLGSCVEVPQTNGSSCSKSPDKSIKSSEPRIWFHKGLSKIGLRNIGD